MNKEETGRKKDGTKRHRKVEVDMKGKTDMQKWETKQKRSNDHHVQI